MFTFHAGMERPEQTHFPRVKCSIVRNKLFLVKIFVSVLVIKESIFSNSSCGYTTSE